MRAGDAESDAASTESPNDAASPALPEPIQFPREVLGRVPTGATLRRELAAAARSRGERSDDADEIVDLHEEIVDIDVPEVDLQTARERVADATGETQRLKERVAAARGDVRARREVDADAEAALAELESAAAALSNARTDRVAAEQALARQRERAREARDARERRLRLQDRLANRRRDARAELARSVYPTFRDALEAIPNGDPADAGTEPAEYAGPSMAASFAAVRIADLDEPVDLSRAALSSLSGSEPDVDPPQVVLRTPVVHPDA